MVHRRIPKSRRHKKVKPFVLRSHGNWHHPSGEAVKPEDIDQQNVSRRTKSLFEIQDVIDNQMKSLTNKGRKKRKGKNVEIIEGFKKFRWESDRTFLSRVQQETDAEIQQELVKIKYEKPTAQNSRSATDSGPSSSKERKRNASEMANDTVKSSSNRQKKNFFKNRGDPLNRKEIIRFGEPQVDAPPELNFPRLKTKITDLSSEKPTKKRGDILIHSVINDTSGPSWAITSSSHSNLHSSTIKCDDPSKQKLLEEERRRVIDAYRNLKRNSLS